MSDTDRRLARIERALIEQSELEALGHRIVYDVQTGRSLNVPGCRCRPENLDANGYQIRFDD